MVIIQKECTSCDQNYKSMTLEDIKKTVGKIKELPPKKMLPVYLNGEFKGYIKVRPNFVEYPKDSYILDCPLGFSSWMDKATFGEPVDEV